MLSNGNSVDTFEPVGPTRCDKPSLSSLFLIRPTFVLIFNMPNPQSINTHRSLSPINSRALTLTHQQLLPTHLK